MKKEQNNSKKNSNTKKTRRDFLKLLTLATAGSAVALTQSDKVLAKYLDVTVNNHVDEFISVANTAEVTTSNVNLMDQAVNNLQSLINSNSTVYQTVQQIANAITLEVEGIDGLRNALPIDDGEEEGPTDPEPSDDAENVASTVFLHGLARLPSTGVPSQLYLAQKLSSPSYVLGKIEPGFIEALSEAVNSSGGSQFDPLFSKGSKQKGRERIVVRNLKEASAAMAKVSGRVPTAENGIECTVYGEQADCLGMLIFVIIVIILTEC